MIGNKQELVTEEFGYYIDPRLKVKWDKIKNGRLKSLDEDRVYVTDGREGSGKSLFVFQQAAYIDPTILDGDIPRIAFTPDDFLNVVRNTKSSLTETKVVVFDEAFRGLSSRAALSKTNKKIVQALMEMRQNNLVVFIVLPSFFLLDMYPALLRSNALFHIIKRKNTVQRSFKVYNYQQKAKLFKDGAKKGWNYKGNYSLQSRFYGKWPNGDVFRDKYLKKKQQSLVDMEKAMDGETEESKFSLQRKIFLAALYELAKKTNKTTQEQMVSRLQEVGVEMGRDNLSKILTEMRKRRLICEL